MQPGQRARLHRSVNRIQISHKSLEVFVADIFTRITQLVDNAVLYICLRENRLNGCCEACQVICADIEDVFYAAVSETVQDVGPEFGTFILAYPHPQYILMSVHVNANGDIYGFLDDLTLTADMVMDGVHKHYGIKAFQWSLLPLSGNGQYFVCYAADGGVRHIDAVYMSRTCDSMSLVVMHLAYIEKIFSSMS